MADPNAYTIDNILTNLNTTLGLSNPTDKDVLIYIEGFAKEDLIAKGAEVDTGRIDSESSRNYGTFVDWYINAGLHLDPKGDQDKIDRLQKLDHIDLEWLRLGVYAVKRAVENYHAFNTGASLASDEKQLRQTHADELEEQAKRAREKANRMLQFLAGGIPVWLTKAKRAYAQTSGKVGVATSLLELCKVATEMLADSSEGMLARRKKSTLSADMVKAWTQLAEATQLAIEAAGAVRPTPPVTQGDVDYWDGVALVFFGQFVKTLDAAHEQDATIPASTIISLATFFRRRTRKKRTELEKAEEEAEKARKAAEEALAAVETAKAEAERLKAEAARLQAIVDRLKADAEKAKAAAAEKK